MLNVSAGTEPDFRHIETWIFDLDNTLYRMDSGLYDAIGERMTDFIGRALDMTRDEAERIRDAYYFDHGATLTGLIARHGMDPEPFLDYVHDIDLSGVAPNSGLNAAVAKLPGRKFVFTNGCRNHAARVLDRIGLTHAVEDVWDIRTVGFSPKPNPEAYETVVARAKLAPEHAAMFEDTARNLAPAHALGMTTVWLNTKGSVAPHDLADTAHIHYEIDDLAHFLRTIRT